MTATAIMARFLPLKALSPAAVLAGCLALLVQGQWTAASLSHGGEDWRGAAVLERAVADDHTPVICPSPFVEAQSPDWTPTYPLPGFLYSNLSYYGIRGKLRLFPFQASPQQVRYADHLLSDELLPAGRFLVYGESQQTNYVMQYLSARPELANWRVAAKQFLNVDVVLFESRDKSVEPAERH